MSSNKAAPETATAMPSQAPRLPTGFIVLSPVGEGWREGSKPQGLYWGGEGIRKDCHHSENALSPALPHGGGSGFRQVL
ncbi:TPA: hypothetical protein ACE6MN_001760, partial [Neisseria gonorrhoeae]